VDLFTLIVTVTMVLGFLFILALGFWHPKTGAQILDWKPTRSAEVEAQNDIDDVEQMIAAQNRMRERRGAALRTQDEIEARVKADQRELADYADSYWADQREKRIAALNAEGTITAYVREGCSKCARVERILGERGIDFERVEVGEMDGARIAPLLEKAGLRPGEALREGSSVDPADDEAVLAALAADPTLLQRPIVERGDRAILARPAERVLEIL
jgi:arsenate reductase-like glutaredoxin family protein